MSDKIFRVLTAAVSAAGLIAYARYQREMRVLGDSVKGIAAMVFEAASPA